LKLLTTLLLKNLLIWELYKF